jgi:hypothetical protein
VQTGFPFDDEFGAGNRHVNADVIKISLLLVLVWKLNNNAAAHNRTEKSFELIDLFANARFNRLRTVHVAK